MFSILFNSEFLATPPGRLSSIVKRNKKQGLKTEHRLKNAVLFAGSNRDEPTVKLTQKMIIFDPTIG